MHLKYIIVTVITKVLIIAIRAGKLVKEISYLNMHSVVQLGIKYM